MVVFQIAVRGELTKDHLTVVVVVVVERSYCDFVSRKLVLRMRMMMLMRLPNYQDR